MRRSAHTSTETPHPAETINQSIPYISVCCLLGFTSTLTKEDVRPSKPPRTFGLYGVAFPTIVLFLINIIFLIVPY